MSTAKLSSEALLSKTIFLAREERRITLELIEHLREIERRMLFAELGFGSLHDFCVKRLGLSEGSAQRRIQAMRLARELPEVKRAILDGEISLTNAAKLQGAFQMQRLMAREKGETVLGLSEKREVLKEISGLTQKECEAKLLLALPSTMEELSREKTRKLGPNSTEIRLVVTDEFMGKLDRLKELLSHAVPSGKTLEIFERLLDGEIARIEKKKGLSFENASGGALYASDGGHPQDTSSLDTALVRIETVCSGFEDHSVASRVEVPADPVPPPAGLDLRSRKSIPAKIMRVVWRRARGTCEIPGCRSRHRLEVDHIHPRALGGGNELSNLRLICKTHNLSEARKWLGEGLMRKHVERLRA
jgi:5-methylcytosine-specific restriction endonuclease McrA